MWAQLTSITQMPNKGSVDFILRYTGLKEKLILTSKTSAEIVSDEVLVSRLFLRSVEEGLDSNLILQELKPVPRSQGVTDEDMLSATKKAGADERERQVSSLKDPAR